MLLSAKDKRRAKIPNRSKKAIRRKLLSMGLVKPVFTVKFHRKRAWTQDEINLLKSSDPRKAKIPGRSRQSIVCMAIRLKLINKKPAKRPWKKKDEKLLVQLAKEGKTPSQIVKMGVFSKSRNSIQKKLCYLGFAEKAPQIKKFPQDVLSKFKEFLKENWKGKTPQELTDLWNEHNEFKIAKNKVVYHLTAMEIKIPYAEVMVINHLRKTEEEIKKEGASSAKQLDENLRLARAKIMRERILKNRDIWTGLPLKENFEEIDV